MFNKNFLYLFFSVIFFLGVILIVSFYNISNNANNLCEYDYVEKVIDGDTIFTEKLGKVRFIGIDAPEIFHTGWTEIKSYKFYGCGNITKKIVEKYILHKKVLLCGDIKTNDKGGFGRYLRYVMLFTGEKSVPLGYFLVKSGFAMVYKNADFSWKKKYNLVEDEAKKNKIGIWQDFCIKEDKDIKNKYLTDN